MQSRVYPQSPGLAECVRVWGCQAVPLAPNKIKNTKKTITVCVWVKFDSRKSLENVCDEAMDPELVNEKARRDQRKLFGRVFAFDDRAQTPKDKYQRGSVLGKKGLSYWS